MDTTSPSQPRRPDLRLLVAMLTVLGLFFVLDRIDVPHPIVYNKEQAAKKVAAAPGHRMWQVTHAYGALCAQHLDIPHWQERAALLPEGVGYAFYDGAAHHMEVDFDDMQGQVDTIKEHIPEDYWLPLFDGMMRAFTAAHGDEPDRVLAWAERLQEISGAQTLINGLRIGLQQGYGDSIDKAISIAARFPTELQGELFEELGWRVGHDADFAAESWKRHTHGLQDDMACHFAEGMVRGRVLWLVTELQPWWGEVAAFREGVPSRCHSQIESGVAEALLISVGDRPEAVEAELTQVPRGPIHERVVAIIDKRSGD